MTVWAFDLPLTTDRLLLRAHRPDDLDDLVVFHGDPLVTRYIPWPTRTREQTRQALEGRVGHTTAAAPGDWIILAMQERDTGTVVGEVLLKREGDGRAEVGYAMRTDRQGKGLASEAVAALLDAAAATLGVTDVEAIVVDGNDASVRLLLRLGFEAVGPGPAAEDETTTQFRRLRA
jgi:RimJ/RimL family protein N-acetyltransferase